MKRIVSLIMVLMMCVSITAFADDYDFLSASYTGYEADIEVTMTVNEPMTVLALISQMSGIDNFVNLQMLAESLCNSKTTGVIKLNSDSDYTKAKMSYEILGVTPFAVNRNLKLSAEMKFGMWLEWDIADEMNPVFKYILQQPFADKYISVDLTEMLADEGISVPDVISSVKGYLDRDYINSINAKFTDILRNNSSLETMGNKITVTLTNEQLVNVVIEVMDFIVEEFDDNEDYELLSDGDTGYISEMLPDAEAVKGFFDEFQLFDSTALVMECTKTPGGALKTSSTCINMNINIGKILEETDVQLLEGEAQNLKFSVKTETKYKSVNGNIKVDFPVLSDEDIIDFEELLYMEEEYIPEWDTETCFHDEYVYLYNKHIPSAKNTFYVSLQDITESFAGYGYEYQLDIDGNQVTLTEAGGKDSFKKAEMQIDSNEISVDGAAYTLQNPVIMSDGVIYADTDALTHIFGINLDYAAIDLTTDELIADLSRRSPQCHHTEDEIYGFEESEECEHYQLVNISSDFPYYGVAYIKIRDIINEIYEVCGVHYENGVLTLTDDTGKSGVTTLVITVDSNEYIVDGVAKKIGMPATEYRDSVYIDVNAALEIFGFELSSPQLVYIKYYDEITASEAPYMAYTATLARKSPYCNHTDEELADYYKWWE